MNKFIAVLIFLFAFVLVPFIAGTIDYRVQKATEQERKDRPKCWMSGPKGRIWYGQPLCKKELSK